jgi:hypothetical protein
METPTTNRHGWKMRELREIREINGLQKTGGGIKIVIFGNFDRSVGCSFIQISKSNDSISGISFIVPEFWLGSRSLAPKRG